MSDSGETSARLSTAPPRAAGGWATAGRRLRRAAHACRYLLAAVPLAWVLGRMEPQHGGYARQRPVSGRLHEETYPGGAGGQITAVGILFSESGIQKHPAGVHHGPDCHKAPFIEG